MFRLLSLFFFIFFFFFNDTATTDIYTLSLHDALPLSAPPPEPARKRPRAAPGARTPPGEMTPAGRAPPNGACAPVARAGKSADLPPAPGRARRSGAPAPGLHAPPSRRAFHSTTRAATGHRAGGTQDQPGHVGRGRASIPCLRRPSPTRARSMALAGLRPPTCFQELPWGCYGFARPSPAPGD